MRGSADEGLGGSARVGAASLSLDSTKLSFPSSGASPRRSGGRVWGRGFPGCLDILLPGMTGMSKMQVAGGILACSLAALAVSKLRSRVKEIDEAKAAIEGRRIKLVEELELEEKIQREELARYRGLLISLHAGEAHYNALVSRSEHYAIVPASTDPGKLSPPRVRRVAAAADVSVLCRGHGGLPQREPAEDRQRAATGRNVLHWRSRQARPQESPRGLPSPPLPLPPPPSPPLSLTVMWQRGRQRRSC